MDITSLLRHYAGYAHWANTRFVERLSTEPDELLDRTVASSFPSLRATLLHIRDADHAWLCRLTGAQLAWPAEPSVTLDTVVAHSSRLLAHVQALDEAAAQQVLEYKDLRGNVHAQPAWQMLLHCFNHGTQHRGQLITMMRGLGMDRIPANDMVVYQRSLV
jgi:uncharacterized damage-inducible protein DinB